MTGICHVIWLASNWNVLFLLRGVFWTLRCLRKAGNCDLDLFHFPDIYSSDTFLDISSRVFLSLQLFLMLLVLQFPALTHFLIYPCCILVSCIFRVPTTSCIEMLDRLA